MTLLTTARDLQRRKARERSGTFVAEGVRTVEALLASSLHVTGVLVSPSVQRTPRAIAVRQRALDLNLSVTEVSEAEFASASDTDSAQGILAVARVPDFSYGDLPSSAVKLLVLDAVQDPGNVGTILRTAAAFGVTATVALPGTVDLWNAKVVRSGMGSHFVHPTLVSTIDALAQFCQHRALPVFGADAAGVPVDQLQIPPQRALMVGNEGAGLSPESLALVQQMVALPIDAAVESLNVAVATGILLFAFR
jgi:RNA methyltransferase, TrmH family